MPSSIQNLKKLKLILVLSIAPILMTGTMDRAYGSDHYAYGVKLFKDGYYKDAGNAFKTALKKNPANTNAIYYLALSLQKSGDTEGAISFYSHLVKNYPNSKSARYAGVALNQLTSNTTGGSQASSHRQSQRSSLNQSSAHAGDYIPDSENIGFKTSDDAQKHMIVNCRINNRNLPMLFDTGSTICMVGKNHLQQIGLPPPSGKPTNQVKAVGGIVDAWEVPTQISLGRIVRTIDLVVVDKLGTPMLGQSFLGDLKYEIDNSRKTISFKKPGSRADFVQAGTIDIPLTIQGSNLIVTAKVNGRPMPFFFDTGAGASIMPLSQLKNMGDRGFRKVGEADATGAAGVSKSMRYEVDSIELGPIRKQGLVIAVSPSYNYKYGLLGRDFFGNSRFTVDKQNKVIHFAR